MPVQIWQAGLLAEAEAFRDANIVDVGSYDDLKAAVEDGKWARGLWAGAWHPNAFGESEQVPQALGICSVQHVMVRMVLQCRV